MSNYFHIAIGDSPRGTIRVYFKEHKDSKYYGETRCFRDDLSTGSIYELERNIDKRVQWFKQMFIETVELEFIKEIDKEIEENYNLELSIPEDGKIIVWHGDNVIEQTALRYLANRFKNNEIYEISVSKSVEKEFNGEKYKARATGECNPEEIGKALENISLIKEDTKQMFMDEWNELRKSKSTLRILKDGKIINVDESYYDADILEYTPNEFMKAARVIGTVMGMSQQVVGDTFIDYRLRKLIEAGKIEYRGKLRSMREFDIKIK
ncbi:DUF3658 domain-containing protein [Clostridium aestuarii]|uniref:DUF3658 domain-containing protein n=1 Tax=Clostridium aestuarii TaxID=338193 RepID=A0ABT4D2E6_9CLOT|nr:DUF3658 domain-containing protein [Clostridium aestuarii]